MVENMGHIVGRRWFQRLYGNTYHSVTVHLEGENVHVPFEYGGGEMYLQTAHDALVAAGVIPPRTKGAIWQDLRDAGFTWSARDVGRKRDLKLAH